jgi:hypothetical protein
MRIGQAIFGPLLAGCLLLASQRNIKMLILPGAWSSSELLQCSPCSIAEPLVHLHVTGQEVGIGRWPYSQKEDKRSKEQGKDAPESILKPPRDILEVTHPARASSLSPLGLLAPLVATDLGRGETAGCAGCRSHGESPRRGVNKGK